MEARTPSSYVVAPPSSGTGWLIQALSLLRDQAGRLLLKEFSRRKHTEAELRRLAGGGSLMKEALAKVAAAETDLAEVDRVIGSGK